jgi:hypothetical protein
MTTRATTLTPYRTNAAVRSHGRFAWSRRTIHGLIACGALPLCAIALLAVRAYVHQRDDVALANANMEARSIQRSAAAWRTGGHPFGCPTLVDLGMHPMEVDPWNTGYTIVCSGTTTAVRSAGPDRTYFTADDPRYPE